MSIVLSPLNQFQANFWQKKKNLEFIVTLFFTLQRKILNSFFFFSQLIELFHTTMKKKIENSAEYELCYEVDTVTMRG